MIPRHRWKEADVLLERLLQLPKEERAAEIDGACSHDEELRQAVESLLAKEQDTDSLLASRPLANGLGSALCDELVAHAPADAPTAIGAYALTGELGRGGMGVVYAAERSDGDFEQRVAIKLLHADIRSAENLERFRQERRILASLDHPSVTRLLDGGTTSEGRPYVVMERVDGVAIDRYCDEHRLDLNRRLAMWLKVAEAVGYAHRRLLVHRDLKPSNVLVTAEGEVKLLDFGIAKLLEPQEAEGALGLTESGLRPMTRRYASPEQVTGGEITTATDVYQMGLLLYQLVSGRSPFRTEGSGALEVEEAIRDQEPTKPSEAVRRSLGEGGARVLSHVRGTTPAKLANDLAGDLDAITLKALRKEPEARYGSVREMQEDIERYLAGLPVSARQGSALYRARRLLARHRYLCAAIGLICLVCVGLVAFHTKRLAAERDRARQETAKVRGVSAFLTDLFRGGNPELEGRGDLLARDLLDRGARRIEEELADQPEVRAEVQRVIAHAYQALGRLDDAEVQLEAALATVRGTAGHRPGAAAMILDLLGDLSRERGDYARAAELFEEGLGIRREELGPEAVDVSRSLNNLGLVRYAQGRYEAAGALYEEAIAIKEREFGPVHISLVSSLTNLSSVHYQLGDYRRSEELNRRAIAIHERLGGGAPGLATLLTNLGRSLIRTGELREAGEHLERALEIKERAYGAEHPRLAVTLNVLAGVAGRLGDLEEARGLYERSVALYRRGFGQSDVRVATPLNNLGQMLLEAGEPSPARRIFEETLSIRLEKLGAGHSRVAYSRLWLAKAIRSEGNLLLAESQLSRALETLRLPEGPDDLLLSDTLLELAGVFVETGRAAQAEPLLRESLELKTAALGRDHRDTANTVLALGRCLIELGSHDEGQELLQEAEARDVSGEQELAAH